MYAAGGMVMPNFHTRVSNCVPSIWLYHAVACCTCLQVRFVTNTTKDTTSNLVRMLQKMGFDIQEHEVGAASTMG
jgi:hypothetical protein